MDAVVERDRPQIMWLRLAETGLLLLALGLRLWRLDQNGFGTEYYSAGVRSMTQSWHNFFYNSFDPAGFLSVDKPPVALWVQVAGAKLFGFHPLSLLLPQVLEGIAAVWVLYRLVRRHFGAMAGLLAALFLAITPVSVAIDRSNNTDSCLVLVLLLAGWALIRAVECGSRLWLSVAMALVGIGFNVKMLAAVVVVPTFVLVYGLGAPLPVRRRVLDLTLAGLVMFAISLAWVVAYDLTPPEQRPFVGSSKENSMLELAVGHNGIERFVRRNRPPRPSPVDPTTTTQSPAPGEQPDGGSRGPGWPRIDRVPAGPLRLADRQLAGQVAWMLPLAAMGLTFGAPWRGLRAPLAPPQLMLLLWAGWALTYGIVYSAAAGIFHAYYLATMAPALAALAGVAVVALWRRYLEGGPPALLLPATVAITSEWQAYIQSAVPGWTALSLALLAGTRIAVLTLLITALAPAAWLAARSVAMGALATAVVTLLLTPGAWALSSVLASGGVMPSADLSRLAPDDDGTGGRRRAAGWRRLDTRKLVRFFQANHHGERFLAATASTQLAAPIIIETGQAVMAMGGFMGGDPILTPEKLARLVADGEVRFVMVGDSWGLRRRFGLEPAGRVVTDWVRAHGQVVDPDLWRDPGESGASEGAAPQRAAWRGLASMQLYDLRPQAGIVRGPPG